MIATLRRVLVEAVALTVSAAVFLGPLLFIFFMAGKTTQEAGGMGFSAPATFDQYLPNVVAVVQQSNYLLIRAFVNSVMITVLSIVIVVVVSGMAGFILDRRLSRVTKIANLFVLLGIMIPPSVITTIWVLQGVGLFKTLIGLVLVEVALAFPFAVILFRAFMVTVPREMDEAAVMEGCSGRTMYLKVIFPLLKSVSATVTVLNSVHIFNDFVNPLYFLPGAQNATLQLTLFNFISRYSTQWNLLFTDVLLLTIPPFVLFLFFNKKIVAGMVAGAIKS